MLSDTITLTIDGVAKTLTRNGFGDRSSSFFLRDGVGYKEYTLLVRHTTVPATKNRLSVDRHNVELKQVSPPNFGSTLPVISRTYIVFETPPGVVADGVNMSAGLYGALVASTNAMLNKLTSYEV